MPKTKTKSKPNYRQAVQEDPTFSIPKSELTPAQRKRIAEAALQPRTAVPFNRPSFRVGKLAAAIVAEHAAADAYVKAVGEVRVLHTHLMYDDDVSLDSAYRLLKESPGQITETHWLTESLDKQNPDWWVP